MSLVAATGSGIDVRWIGAGTSFILGIPGHTFPPPCQSDPARCHITIMSRYLAISALRTVIIVDLEGGGSQTPIVVPLGLDCDPTDLFFVRVADTPSIIAACEHNSSLMLQYVYIFLEMSDNTELTVQPDLVPTVTVSLESMSGFSQTILVPNRFCTSSGGSTFFVLADGVIWSHPATGNANTFTARSDQLQNCTTVLYIEYTGLSGDFTIYCSNEAAISYSTCSERVQSHFLSQDGLPFPCPSSTVPVTVFYKTDSIRVVQVSNPSVVSSFNHSVGGIRRGACMGNSSFAAIATNGSLYVIDISSEDVSPAIANVCNGSCVRPPFGAAGFPLYDVMESSIKVVSLVEECNWPIVEMLTFDGNLPPSFISAVATGTQRSCECSVKGDTTTESPEGPMTPPGDNTTIQPDTTLMIVRVVVPSVVAAVLVVVVIGIIVVVCICKQ